MRPHSGGRPQDEGTGGRGASVSDTLPIPSRSEAGKCAANRTMGSDPLSVLDSRGLTP
jgi:hypothetical protein